MFTPYSISDVFLPPYLKTLLREIKEFTDFDHLPLNFTHAKLLENREIFSDLFRTRMITLMAVVYLLLWTLPWLALGLDPAHVAVFLPRILFASLFLLLIRSGRASYRAVMMVMLFYSVYVSFKAVFAPEQAHLKELPPLIRYFSTWTPALPVSSFYVLGDKRSLPYVFASVILLALSFSASLEGTYLVSFSRNHHTQYVILSLLVQLLPLSFLLAFDAEARLYHTLLLKSLQVTEEKSRAKTTFISRMSHELRTPLQGLLSSASLLKETHLTEDQLTFLSIIDSCGSLLLNIMEKILDITRIESGRFETQAEPFNLLELVPSLLESVTGISSSKGVDVFISFDLNGTYEVHGDQKHLRGILTNLFGNAVKFTDKGSVNISICEKTRLDNQRSLYRFEIADTGKGMPEKILDQLFEPFTKAHNYHHKEGSGLGLSIAKKFTESLGGTIGVETTLGVGSLFWVEIPFTRLPAGSIGPSLLAPPREEWFPAPIRLLVLPQTQQILSDYFGVWRLPFEVLNSPMQIWESSAVVVVEEGRFEASGLKSVAEVFVEGLLSHLLKPELRILFLASLSSLHQTKTLIERYRLSDVVTIIPVPLTPVKLCWGLANMGSSGSSSMLYTGESQSEEKEVSLQRVASQSALQGVLSRTHYVPSLDVLLVEDNPVNQTVMKKLFSKFPIRFEVTSSAEEAVAIWERSPRGISLILMDVELDGEMTGLQATAIIRQRERLPEHSARLVRSHIAVMTGRALEKDRREAFSSGCDEFLVKPVSLDKLKEMVTSIPRR